MGASSHTENEWLRLDVATDPFGLVCHGCGTLHGPRVALAKIVIGQRVAYVAHCVTCMKVVRLGRDPPGTPGSLDARIALGRFLDAINSRNGVGTADWTLAQLAIGSYKRQAEAARLIEKLMREIQDDGPLSETLRVAEQEAER